MTPKDREHRIDTGSPEERVKLDTFCIGCGRQATWYGGEYNDRLHILGPQHPLVKSGATVIGHHCEICYQAARKRATK